MKTRLPRGGELLLELGHRRRIESGASDGQVKGGVFCLSPENIFHTNPFRSQTCLTQSQRRAQVARVLFASCGSTSEWGRWGARSRTCWRRRWACRSRGHRNFLLYRQSTGREMASWEAVLSWETASPTRRAVVERVPRCGSGRDLGPQLGERSRTSAVWPDRADRWRG